MYTKFLSNNTLSTPPADGGLWRIWPSKSQVNIRQHPPRCCGGDNLLSGKGLMATRHSAVNSKGHVAKTPRLAQTALRLREKYQKLKFLWLTGVNYTVIMLLMILEQLRKEIETCGKSRYKICSDTGIDKAALSRIMTGGSCKAETIDILLEYFGLTIAKKGKKKAR